VGNHLANWIGGYLFILIHLGCLGAIWTGVSWTSVWLCFGLYWLRVFALTAGYHRYFSHRSFKTSRWFQCVLAVIACSAVQKGPLWWAAKHRRHHRFSDQEEDVHSPVRHSLFWSHVGWILSGLHERTDYESVRDLARYPELHWLNRYHWAPALALAILCFAVDGMTGLVWGFCISTVLVYHVTFAINSLSHVIGRRRYQTTDDSRNNFVLAVLTMGEGWHNNHHHYQSSANQGFFWWEIDCSYYLIRLLGLVGLVWDIRTPPAKHRDMHLRREVNGAGALATAKMVEA
jgi:stearoyl-CoA desaturase (delta-9 desaturase)